MKVEKNKVVTLIYTLKSNNEIVEVVQQDQPFLYLVGSHGVIPKFGEALEGLSVDEDFEVKISSKEAYGEVITDAIVDVPLTTFEVDGEIKYDILAEGNVVPLQDQDGTPMDGIVLSVSDESVKLDFNHPLAGKDLHFTGKVLDIRDANAEEIEHGHVHGEGGHKH